MGDFTAHSRKLLPGAKIEVSDEIEESLHLVDSQRLRKELGFEPAFTLEHGLEDYLREVKSRKEQGELG